MKTGIAIKEQTEKTGAVLKDFFLFLRNLFYALIVGIGVGAYAALFALLITWITDFRSAHMWLLFLLPVGGLAIAGLYKLLKVDRPKGTNRVLESVSKGEDLPFLMAPLITVSTAITHFVGGSAGREGAALQIGGSLGRTFGKIVRLDSKNLTIMTLCGMAAAFSAMFGTPITAAVFAMEVVSIGIMHYSALLPCAVASLSASLIARAIGVSAEGYTVSFPSFGWLIALKVVGLGIACALVSILFCVILHKVEHFYQKYIPNTFLRAACGGVFIIMLTIIVGSSDYNGAGSNIIEAAVEGEALPLAFLLKMIFTAFTLGAGFKGGEIVPTLFIGATFGCVFGPLIGLPASTAAALGMCALFCGVTNCPIASILLAVELFGAGGLPLYFIVIAVSYRLSGYYSLYSGQKIMYSKTEPTFVNKNTH